MLNLLTHAVLCPSVQLPTSRICQDCPARGSEKCSKDLRNMIEERHFSREQAVDAGPELNVRVTQVLRRLGVPVHIKGYALLRSGLVMAVADPDVAYNVVKKLYEPLSVLHGTTPSKVERNMRHAIECAWARMDHDTQAEWFGNTVAYHKDKPTNSEFVALVADHIREELRNS